MEHEGVEVVIITGYGSIKSAMEGIRYGESAYLLKPLNVPELVSVLSQTLEKKQRLALFRSLLGEQEDGWSNENKLIKVWERLKGHYTEQTVKDTKDVSSRLLPSTPLLPDLLEA